MWPGCSARLLGKAWSGSAIDCVLNTETAEAFVASVCEYSVADGVVLCCPVVTGYESWVARQLLGLRVHVAIDALASLGTPATLPFSVEQLKAAVSSACAARDGPRPAWERPPTVWLECPVVINHKALRVLGRDDSSLPTPYLAAMEGKAMTNSPRVRVESKTGARVRIFVNKTLVCEEDAMDLEIEVDGPTDFVTADRATLRVHGDIRTLNATLCTVNQHAPPRLPVPASSSSSSSDSVEGDNQDEKKESDDDDESYAPKEPEEQGHVTSDEDDDEESQTTAKRRKIIVISDDEEPSVQYVEEEEEEEEDEDDEEESD